MFPKKIKDSNLFAFFKFIKWVGKVILIITGILPLARCSSGYGTKNGKPTFNGKEITDESFIVLSKEFAKDSATAYYKEYPFQYADVATFEAVDEHYAKDKNKVYYCDEYREGQNYYMTKRQTISELKNVDPTSFVSLQNGYGKDNKQAWFEGRAFAVKDVSTITSLDRNFATDDAQAYINCKPIRGSDGKTFQLIDRNFAKDTNHVYYYAFDGESNYQVCTLPCDKQTFKIIDDRYSKDKDHVFFLGFTIQGADAGSFQVLKSGYSKDANAVYFQSKKISGVHPASFQVYQENESFIQDVAYAKDNTSVYVNDKKLTGADVATFTLLGENYSRDSRYVFYKTMIVKDTNPASFTVYPHDIGNADAEEGTTKFHEGVKVPD